MQNFAQVVMITLLRHKNVV